MNEWIDKMWYIPRVELYLFLERNEHSMNLGDIMPSEISHKRTNYTQKDKGSHLQEVPQGFKFTDIEINMVEEGREERGVTD